MTPLLFLDIDGCLNSAAFLNGPRTPEQEKAFRLGEKHSDWIDPVAISRLQRIIDETECKIVISSTWRLMHKLSDLRDLLQLIHGLRADIIGKTPDLRGEPRGRGHEIQAYLSFHRLDRATFIILDDDADMVHLNHRLVKTEFATGLIDEHVDKAIAMLKERE